MTRALASVAVAGLALPLAACATSNASGVGLVHAGCPDDIRIATDDLPRVHWGFLYGLIDPDRLEIGDGTVSGPLLLDGEPSGATLTILTGDRDDGVSANVALHDDESILLGAVDTDVAILDAVRYPTVGVFAPMLRDSRIAYWDTTAYAGVGSISGLGNRLTPDGAGLVPFLAPPGDPFLDFAIGDGILSADQIVTDREISVPGFVEAGGVQAQTGDLLIDPHLLSLPDTGTPGRPGWQLIDDAGYERDTVLAARPQALVRYADCLGELVPALQLALADYVRDPEPTTALLVELSAQFGDATYDAALAATALELLESEDLAGNGRDDTIGDIDLGRVRDLFEEAIPAWKRADVAVPGGVTPDDIVTNDFIDRSIGARN